MKKALARLRPSLSALTAPLSSVDEFFVSLDEPHRVWAPGDALTGVVVLDLPKPVLTTQVRLRLLGQLTVRNPLVKGPSFRHVLCHEEIVLWDAAEQTEDSDLPDSNTAAASASTTSNNTQSNTTAPSSSASSSSSSISSANAVAASQASSSTPTPNSVARKLPRGEHSFAFMFELPTKGLMTSLEFEKGSIVYMLTASHHRPGPFPPATAHKILPLQCPLDIADLPPPKPSMLSVEIKKKTRKSRESGTATAIVETPSAGCLRGESIPVKITVRHVREVRSVTGVVITFLRISRVCAHDLEPLSFRKDLVQTVVPLYIDSRSLTTTITANIRVPTEIFPTIDEYPLVAFKYCLEVVLDLSGKADLPLSAHVAPTQADAAAGVDLTSRPYVDTELLKRVKGVVSLWNEIVVGTERSEHICAKLIPNEQVRQNSNSSPIPAQQSFASGPATQSAVRNSTASLSNNASSAGSSMPVPPPMPPSTSSVPEYTVPDPHPASAPAPIASSSSSSAAPVSTAAPGYSSELPSTSAPAYPPQSEKERLALLEQALLPSEPPAMSSVAVPDAPPLAALDGSAEFLSPPEMPASGSGSTAADESEPRPLDKLEQERERLLQLASAPDGSASTSTAPASEDQVPVYSATAPPRNAIEAFPDDDPTPRSLSNGANTHDDSDAEDDDGADWVPVYSPNANEEFVSMGGYHHTLIGYNNGYDLADNANVPCEYAVHPDDV
ncbi:hypothetical protein BZA70DRAFT_151812 [Myxozyma melibiosi]|uniref:pH-response regulator protein palF/RIM8 n=1 Tax=Myxozyma melibiosi TaxID=54550 RepID=A0ABR1F631_9ASCO